MSDIGGNGVRITHREVYDKVESVDRKVDLLIQRDGDADALHRDHEARIRALEVWRWKAAGAIALIVLFVSAFGYFIAQAVVHHP